jgi:hypothetical protein
MVGMKERWRIVNPLPLSAFLATYEGFKVGFAYRLSSFRKIIVLELFLLGLAGCSHSDPLREFKEKTKGREVSHQVNFFFKDWTWKDLYDEGKPQSPTWLCGDVYECDDPDWHDWRLVRLTVSVDEKSQWKEMSRTERKATNGKWILDGREELVFKDGKRDMSHHSNGVLDGIHEAWHANGQLAIREYYKDGKQTGACVGWRPDGTKEFESKYENDVEVWGHLCDETGNPEK